MWFNRQLCTRQYIASVRRAGGTIGSGFSADRLKRRFVSGPSGYLFPVLSNAIHGEASFVTKGEIMRYLSLFVSVVAVALFAFAALPSSQAPTGFDNKSNGMVDDPTHQIDQAKFEEVENLSDGPWSFV
jgi:hypothetical protein